MYVVHRSPDLFIIEHLSKAEAHILALRSLNLPFKYIITSLFLYPLLLGAPLPLGALRVRVVCLWVNPALAVLAHENVHSAQAAWSTTVELRITLHDPWKIVR